MSVTPTSFRAQFRAFSDVTTYPDTDITLWVTLYEQMVNADRWGDLTDFGISLAVAHNLVLEAQSVKAAAVGNLPGQKVGIVNNKSVDKASVGYDTTAATEQGAGFWNLTTYGTRYWRYAMIFGAGPVQVNTPPATGELSPLSGAWFGPPMGPY